MKLSIYRITLIFFIFMCLPDKIVPDERAHGEEAGDG